MVINISELLLEKRKFDDIKNSLGLTYSLIMNEMNNICEIVKSDGISQANNMLKDNILEVSKTMKEKLNELSEFMGDQLESYANLNIDVSTMLNSLIQLIDKGYDEKGNANLEVFENRNKPSAQNIQPVPYPAPTK